MTPALLGLVFIPFWLNTSFAATSTGAPFSINCAALLKSVDAVTRMRLERTVLEQTIATETESALDTAVQTILDAARAKYVISDLEPLASLILEKRSLSPAALEQLG